MQGVDRELSEFRGAVRHRSQPDPVVKSECELLEIWRSSYAAMLRRASTLTGPQMYACATLQQEIERHLKLIARIILADYQQIDFLDDGWILERVTKILDEHHARRKETLVTSGDADELDAVRTKENHRPLLVKVRKHAFKDKEE